MSKSKKKVKKKSTFLPTLLVILALAAACAFAVVFLNKWEVKVTLNGDKDIVLEYPQVYEDPGAEAVYTGSLLPFVSKPLEVTVTSEVDSEHTGIYTVTYSAEYGEHKSEASRTVTIQDTTPPVLVLKETEDSYTPYNHSYEEEGFTATDLYDGDLAEKVTKEEKDGKVYYTVSDSSGNTTTLVRHLVYDDRKAPVISFNSGDYEVIYAGDDYDRSYYAEDDCDGDVTANVSVSGSVDTDSIGTYYLHYTVTDEHGNTAEADKTVDVIAKPVNKPQVNESSKTVYLTFDDGPGPYTDELLEILDRYNVKATFFTTSAYPGYAYCMAKEAAAGHVVAVHSATHNYAQIYSSESAYWADFDIQNSVIESQTGSGSTLFRFPGGSSNTVSRNYNSGIMTRLAAQASSYGLTYFDWNVSSGDAGETTDTYVVYSNVINGIQANSNAGRASVVLQHDVKGYSVAAVEDIIKWGLANGYTFSALSAGSSTCHHGLNN